MSSDRDRTKTSSLLKSLEELINPNETRSDGDESMIDRKRASALAHSLWLELEDPGDMIDRIVRQPQENAMLNVALDLGIYDLLIRRSESIQCHEIAEDTNADLVLVERIMRNLAGLGHVDETGPGTFQANKVTAAFTTPKGISLARFSHQISTPAWNSMPAFLKRTEYRNPTDPLDLPIHQALGSEKHFFELLVERNALRLFQNAMVHYRTGRAEFVDVFPAEELLLEGLDDKQANHKVLLVDVGGGQGHEIQKIRRRLPSINARMVLQDQEEALKGVADSEGMEVMVHDFFTTQSVEGARCYYFRMIFHDWPDAQCIEILKNTVSAMEPGYSKVLINDMVLPDVGATRYATQSDINMMALLGAMERSEDQWRRLLKLAGLEVVKIWPGVPESVIEAVCETT